MAKDKTPEQTPDQKLIQEIKGNFEQLKKRRLPYEPTWDELFETFLPRLSPVNASSSSSEGEKRTKAIMDQEPQHCLRIASAGYQGWMFPRSQLWFRFNFEAEEVAQLPDARRYCQQLERATYAELRRGGFYRGGGEWTDIALAMATGALYVGDDRTRGVCSYLAMHPKEVYLAFGSDGRPDTCYRNYPMTGRQILQEWPKAQLPEGTKKKLEDAAYEKQDVLWAVGPRTDRVYGMLDAQNMPYYSVYLLQADDTLFSVGGFPEFPVVVWRPRTVTDEDYGRSQGWDTLSTAKRLQQVAKSSTKGIQLGILPPLHVPEEMMDSYDLTPWGPNPYKSELRKITPIITSVAVEPALKLEADLRQQLRDGWDVPFFMMMMAMAGRADRTATEVYETAGERSILMGTTVGGLEDCLIQVLDLTLKIAARAGRLPSLPASLEKLKNANLKADLVGPLSMLQKRYHGQQAFAQTLAQGAIFLKLFPDSRAVVNGVKSFRKFLEAGGWDADSMNDDKQVAAILEAEAKARQAELSLKLMETMGKAAPGLKDAAAQGAGGDGASAEAANG